ncbi:MAG: hypothetical protein KY429_06245 [Actinobacteria bacterium]|nr:hypothetical protein [Actinomycetota bacterium]
MKKGLIAILVLLVLGSAMVPAWAQSIQVSFQGTSSARALDLSIPALRQLGLQDQFKGLTVGLTSADFSISSSNKAVSGFAAGKCEFIASQPDPGALPCDQSTVETSSVSSPGGNGACVDNSSIAVVNLATACGKSASSLTSAGLPSSLNEAGVASARVSANLADLGLGAALGVEATKDQLLTAVQGLTNDVLTKASSAPVAGEKVAALRDATNEFLANVADGNQFAVLKVGASTTNVIPDGSNTNVVSEAAGAKIGLLGLTNALEDGLVIVEISSGKAMASFDGTSGLAQASAVGPVATVKVRDLINLDNNAATQYLEVIIQPEMLNSLLAPLSSAPLLETTVEAGSHTQGVQTGKSVSAFASGVTIHALKGLGESEAGKKDGGILLRIAAADVRLAGDIATTEPPCCALATTGGPVYGYLAGAALMALLALALLVYVRKLRTTV